MKRIVSGLLAPALILTSTLATAHEGMWLPMLIKRLNYAEMQANGLNLTAEEIYDIKEFVFCCTLYYSSGKILLERYPSKIRSQIRAKVLPERNPEDSNKKF